MVRQYRCGYNQTPFDIAEEMWGKDYPTKGIRVGFWHEKPRENEVVIATVRVRAHDPPIPIFQKVR